MTSETEKQAKSYLMVGFKSDRYRFLDKNPAETGFDMLMEDLNTGERSKVELKTTYDIYKKPSDIFEKLCFSVENEVKNFKKGETKVVRVFLGNYPPKVFIFDKDVLSDGAEFEPEFRAKIMGKKNYSNIEEI